MPVCGIRYVYICPNAGNNINTVLFVHTYTGAERERGLRMCFEGVE